MPEIHNLTDALVKTRVVEDQCTNFLLWVLRNLPGHCLQEFCRESGVFVDGISNEWSFSSQWVLDGSRPDARIQLTRDKYLFIETKRGPNALNRAQFQNHITGATKSLGASRCLFLFISGDSEPPRDLIDLGSEHHAAIGFISWKRILGFLDSQKQALKKPYSVFIDEFRIFTRHHQLGKITYMTPDETKHFLAVYPTVRRYQEAAEERFKTLRSEMIQRIVAEVGERVTVSDSGERSDELPLLYSPLNINGWFITVDSAFVFVDIFTKQCGLIAVGYQSPLEKSDLLPLWESEYGHTFRSNPRLQALTWTDSLEDDPGQWRFRVTEGYSGKLFDPNAYVDFNTHFYWGYSYPLDLDVPEETISGQHRIGRKRTGGFVYNNGPKVD